VLVLSLRRPPRQPILRRLFAMARAIADGLPVTAWHHHLRTLKQMADAPANVAMDDEQSSRHLFDASSAGWRGIEHHLGGDTARRQAVTRPGP
jgi:hypothetical protein